MRNRVSGPVAILAAFVLFAAGCGGGDSAGTTAASETTPTAAATPTTAAVTAAEVAVDVPETSGAVAGLNNVRGAVVRIVAEGSFVDPQEGAVANVAGSGSGFIIDPEGIAVTNNHVVTGAAFLQVYLDGEDQPRNAKVLGVTECSDLAIIDIDGSGFPYLDWYGEDIEAGTKVYAAGFPLGDPEYTLTEGIVSKERAAGESSWASVDSVIEHTAQVLPGNSGGPLVTEDGQVLAVNYAGINDFDIQYAISRPEVAKVLDTLVAGRDVTSIGINGEAFTSEEFSGIWVAGVSSGSPAAEIGIKGGDIITATEGLVVATDGTMADYCDILRSHDAGDPLSIEILRWETEEVLEGTLNSGEPLTLAFSFADTLAEEVDNDTTVAYEYKKVTDQDKILVMKVPTAWNDIDRRGWSFDGEIVGNALSASPNLKKFVDTWKTPGVFFAASAALADRYEPGDLLNSYDFSDSCTYDGTYEYDDKRYSGAYDLWADCGASGSTFIIFEAYPPSGDYLILLQVLVQTEADLEAFDKILRTFEVRL